MKMELVRGFMVLECTFCYAGRGRVTITAVKMAISMIKNAQIN